MNDLLQNHRSGRSGPVECLGQTFASDDARREHFLTLLAEMLGDPAFRKQEGFPKGSDAAILAMSDPPYYTACPNPWLAEFVAHYGKPYDPAVKYSREPLAIDVSVGKTDAIYKAHSYHTKVPHLAIVPSILHYTQPGDVVLDGFSGSGMTGVAAQWCGTAPSSYRHELELAWKREGRAAPKWGARRAVLNDLSPAATFIGANYNIPFDVEAFAEAGKQLLNAVEQDIGWMYETLHSDGTTKGRIEYTVWSEVFSCPECAGTVNFIAEALEVESKRVRDVFPCPHCGAELNKDRLERVLETRVDPATGQSWQRVKFQPSTIIYSIGKTRYEKEPDAADLATLAEIETLPLPASVPTSRFPVEDMYHGSRIAPKGFTHIHHFFLPRAAQAMGALWAKAQAHPDTRVRLFLEFFVEQAIWTATLLNRYRPTGFSQVNQYLTGVYYVASQHAECSPWYILDGKLDRLAKTFQAFNSAPNVAVTTGTAAKLPLSDDTVDYIFTDPPFGENIYYADLNFLVEAWHGVTTDAKPEAIIDKFKNKALPDYQHLMQRCFAEYHRVLKPGRWMTVVFSNSKAAVWNAIQVALQQAGFVVAEVTALDKVQGSYRQVTSTTAVKQDLVISAYKPNGGLEDRFKKSGATPESAWDFVQTHLRHLSVTKLKDAELEFIVERDPRRIYDRLVAWFVRHDAPVPLSSDEFLSGLRSRFPERDGMVFLPDQVTEYDKKRAQTAQAPQMELFVSDERSAIDWVADFLRVRPSTYQDIHPEFIRQLGAGWKKHETRPELAALLEANFLRFDGAGEVPSQIHRYLSTNYHDLRGLEKTDPRLNARAQDRWYVPDPNKAQDLEKKRERALLKEFETYKAFAGRKIKESRLEVLRAGFSAAWAAKDYATILGIAHKLPEETLQEDERLLTLYDMALTRTEDGV
ncbi:DNA methylase [Rhizobium leguminosarum bv. viciae]|uniref:DNA methyltransferase n=1 Tax=Rhizobium leguminosarum TaxID=384 RepID=UPI000E0E4C06|nr:DNA methyltransferase [Rhizobium leguminosarum]NEJ80348.1 DNA methylase [Rhizobium leguminosarum]TBY19155.1 DNA methylase [Rhizobium leguminosarum bv. viciae]TBY26686.1 DNA methylase [Rhizobium leguminosarum bv. viciae]TBY54139.1 DNA methylase [Rhizobium leguminosarum bv. viciae]TBY99391.1 DNA methylase [Rhizobium leguminosarum bv. viciae]